MIFLLFMLIFIWKHKIKKSTCSNAKYKFTLRIFKQHTIQTISLRLKQKWNLKFYKLETIRDRLQQSIVEN